MGFLREIGTGNMIPLEPEHDVGRALTCSLRLDEGFVSAQHALLRHDGDVWVLRDLASLNGTWLDGRRIAAGEDHRIGKGSRIAFGTPTSEWEMADDSAPAVMVIPLDGGAPLIVEGDLLALPSAEDPRATIYRVHGDTWMLEEGDGPPTPLGNHRVVHCAGGAWRFSCPSIVRATTRASVSPAEIRLRDLALDFTVSLDEEHVVLRARTRDRIIDLGERVHHYLLLTLARARLEDAQAGTVESSCGWVDVESLCRNARVSRGQISLEVFRTRQQLASHHVLDAPAVVERRPGQLRIGVADVTIERR